MNRETYLKRFFIETYNNADMYNDYLQGKVRLDRDKFGKWYQEIIRTYDIFARYIDELPRFRSKDIIESALSDDLSVSKNFYLHSNNIITSEFGPFAIERYELGTANSYYICNGYFTNTLQNIYKVLQNGSFAVGICSNKSQTLYKDVVRHYRQLKDHLMRNGYRVTEVEHSSGGKNKLYLMTYDSYKQPKKRGDH